VDISMSRPSAVDAGLLYDLSGGIPA
jgi:hypothetical protein